MSQNLVIVESPAKAKTIEKFLGKDFKVMSSYGHITDLPVKEIGVDVNNDFKPNYKISADKKAVVKKLKEAADASKLVWLASDEDREGEAIAWHLYESLKLNEEKTKRIVFHEITERAIKRAIENPRSIDYNLVNAQQARRVLDRLVGYEISPILWRKVKGGLSAGRVQSVVVRLIVEKEREIQNFTPEAYYLCEGRFLDDKNNAFRAKLNTNFKHEDQVLSFLEANTSAAYTVQNVEKKPAKKSPAAPFTTSTLQQEASRKLGFSVSRTMTIAQRLYESGLITYMRTDSVNLSQEALNQAKEEIFSAYGEKYHNFRKYTTKSKGAQEAHEAIRPTDFSKHSISAERDMSRLYELIWKRAIASQMSEAKLERTQINIGSQTFQELFIASGEVIVFDGFLKVYLEGKDEEDEEQNQLLPALVNGQALTAESITATERFSRPPARYSEASLVKRLEELNIGRPSTYAPTITTVQSRNYVTKGESAGTKRKYKVFKLKDKKLDKKSLTENYGSNKGKLIPTDVGMVVNDFLVEHFENILDYDFTAKVEADFDDIASGEKQWTQIMKQFYDDFHPVVKDVAENAVREVGERILGKDPQTGKVISVKLAKYGPVVQRGATVSDEKPEFAGLAPGQSIDTVTLEDALDLFKLPRKLGEYQGEDIEVNNGRFGPYVKYGKKFISIPQGEDLFKISLERAVELVKEREAADAPIYSYKGKPVTKGKGRFGPYIKYDNTFINVNKKYDFDHLNPEDIEALIEDKIKKDKEKIIQRWDEEDIQVEKGRWGRLYAVKGKKRVELDRKIKAEEVTLDMIKDLFKAPSKTKRSKKTS